MNMAALTWFSHGPGLTEERFAGLRWNPHTCQVSSLDLKLIGHSSSEVLDLHRESRARCLMTPHLHHYQSVCASKMTIIFTFTFIFTIIRMDVCLR